MINPGRLYNFLKGKGINFYTGVPDSLLKDFLNYLQEHTTNSQHIITANEGLAVALAAGYYFRSGQVPLVYLQNSGLGNIINPLTSLADKEMYAVPMLLLVGWRGKPGVKDEPQHRKMGRTTIPLLEALEIPYFLLDTNEEVSTELITKAIDTAVASSSPFALLVPEALFEEYYRQPEKDLYSLSREEVIKKLINHLDGSETVICTTGKTGREFYEQNKVTGGKIKKYLLSVGAMGHAGHIALGVATGQPDVKTIVLDGDGSVLMHMGSLATIPHNAPGNFLHIVFNNGCHESVGGQPTTAFTADLCKIATACGYPKTVCITNGEELEQWLSSGIPGQAGLCFVEIRVSRESRNDLTRPYGDPVSWKKNFIDAFGK